jgi:hypothetical protein
LGLVYDSWPELLKGLRGLQQGSILEEHGGQAAAGESAAEIAKLRERIGCQIQPLMRNPVADEKSRAAPLAGAFGSVMTVIMARSYTASEIDQLAALPVAGEVQFP